MRPSALPDVDEDMPRSKVERGPRESTSTWARCPAPMSSPSAPSRPTRASARCCPLPPRGPRLVAGARVRRQSLRRRARRGGLRCAWRRHLGLVSSYSSGAASRRRRGAKTSSGRGHRRISLMGSRWRNDGGDSREALHRCHHEVCRAVLARLLEAVGHASVGRCPFARMSRRTTRAACTLRAARRLLPRSSAPPGGVRREAFGDGATWSFAWRRGRRRGQHRRATVPAPRGIGPCRPLLGAAPTAGDTGGCGCREGVGSAAGSGGAMASLLSLLAWRSQRWHDAGARVAYTRRSGLQTSNSCDCGVLARRREVTIHVIVAPLSNGPQRAARAETCPPLRTFANDARIAPRRRHRDARAFRQDGPKCDSRCMEGQDRQAPALGAIVAVDPRHQGARVARELARSSRR